MSSALGVAAQGFVGYARQYRSLSKYPLFLKGPSYIIVLVSYTQNPFKVLRPLYHFIGWVKVEGRSEGFVVLCGSDR